MATVRKRGRGYQLIYQVDGQPHWEMIYGLTESQARRELEIRVGQALEGRGPTAAARLADVRFYLETIVSGAFDFIVPPLTGFELGHVVRCAAENAFNRREALAATA